MNRFRIANLIWLWVLALACEVVDRLPQTGNWHVELEVQDGKILPFDMQLRSIKEMAFYNAEEEVMISDIHYKGDSIIIEHPVFEGVFKGIYWRDSIKGNFIKPSLDRIVPFRMLRGEEPRFAAGKKSRYNVDGSWETVFSPNDPEERYIAIGIFEQQGEEVTGTFRTTTGDYRYLEGVMDGDTLRLSTFDGAHAFLFEAEVTDSTMQGVFYSGNHWKEPFVAKLNNDYELPDEYSLTYLKEGYDHFNFSFPDVNGSKVSLSDERFKNKVVIVQIMGTWCPNCLEETKYYAEYLQDNPSVELEFVSLAFEYASTRERALSGIRRLIARTGIDYPVLLAQYGTSDKKEAQKKLPMLNHIISYPTTIFIDKKGEVRKIHTGFNGKATDEKYKSFTSEFESFVNELLKE